MQLTKTQDMQIQVSVLLMILSVPVVMFDIYSTVKQLVACLYVDQNTMAADSSRCTPLVSSVLGKVTPRADRASSRAVALYTYSLPNKGPYAPRLVDTSTPVNSKMRSCLSQSATVTCSAACHECATCKGPKL